jgi:hypothetical protein
MGNKGCPHCGNVLPGDSRSCGCGFEFTDEGPEVPGAGVARERSDDTLGKGRKPRARQPEREAKPPPERPKQAGPPKSGPSKAPSAAPDPSRLMDCPFCSARISRRATQCPKCEKEPFLDCQICGERIVAGSSVCPECGDPDPFNP